MGWVLASLALVVAEASAQEADARSDQLIRETLRKPGYPAMRVKLIGEIAKRGEVQFLPDLVGLMADEHREVREAAARAIKSFGWEKMSEPMFKILKRRTLPPAVRELALRTLVSTGRVEVVDVLMGVLDEPALQPAAVEGLKTLTVQDLNRVEDWRKWWAANRNRPRTEWIDSRTRTLLERIARLEAELEASRRHEAELAKRCTDLEKIAADATIRSLEERADKKDPVRLIAALDDPFPRVRIYAAEQLAGLKAVDAVDKLSALAAGANGPEVRVACVTALGQIGVAKAIPVLAGLLSDANEDVAAASARALGLLKAKGTVTRLLAALLSRSAKVREASAEALGQIGAVEAVDPLTTLLRRDPETRVRERAAKALGEIGEVRAYDALVEALEDKGPGVRVYAIEALGALKVEKIAARLAVVLEKDPNPLVREAAAAELANVGNGASIDVLIRVLTTAPEKLAQLCASSILAICRRDETLIAPTADKLVKAGQHQLAVTLYEMLAVKLAERKEDKKLIAVRVKQADCHLALKQWQKAATLLEELTKTLVDDLGLQRKLAWALTELGRHSEAFRIYRKLGAWNECLALLDAMLAEKKTVEVTKLLDEIVKDKTPVPEDVTPRLDAVRKRCDAVIVEQRELRAAEIAGLIRRAAAGGKDAEDARKKVQALAKEALPQLVIALDDANEAVRRTAVEMLREMTKQNFGYRAEAVLKDNAEAIRKWREWIEKQE